MTWGVYVWEYPRTDLIVATKGLEYEEAADISSKILSASMDVDAFVTQDEVPEAAVEFFVGSTVTLVSKEELLSTYL